MGLSDREGTLTFHDVPSNQGLSTLNDEWANYYRAQGMELIKRKIPVTTLARICAEQVGDRPIDFLKIDVEGHECEVLAGGDWNRWRPRVVIVESNERDGWDTAMEAAGYHQVPLRRHQPLPRGDEDRSWLPVLSVPVNATDLYSIHMYLQMIEDARRKPQPRRDSGLRTWTSWDRQPVGWSAERRPCPETIQGSRPRRRSSSTCCALLDIPASAK